MSSDMNPAVRDLKALRWPFLVLSSLFLAYGLIGLLRTHGLESLDHWLYLLIGVSALSVFGRLSISTFTARSNAVSLTAWVGVVVFVILMIDKVYVAFMSGTSV